MSTSGKRTVVITGATRGIGRGLLENLAQCESCQTVIGICRNDSPHLSELQNKFQGNSKVKIFGADVADFNSLNQVAHELRNNNITPDLVIANAGIMTPAKPFWEVSEQEMNESYEVNVRGVFNTMKVFLPFVKDNSNAMLINVSSDWGTCGRVGCAAYCMSKFAVEGLTRAAALDLEQHAATVVSVDPGMVYSDMLIEAFGEDEAKKLGAPCEKFIPHFVNKIMSVDKSKSGQHLDFSLETGGAGPRVAGR